MRTVDIDFLIVGGGIAGASVGYWLAPHGRTLVLEKESQPGYHSTSRSAAMVINSYGPAQVRALTIASRPFFERPPPNFADVPLLRSRGALVLGRMGDDALLAEHWDVVSVVSAQARKLDPTETSALVPVIRPDGLLGSVLEPEAADIDVHALLQGFLRGIRSCGGRISCNAHVDRIEHSGDRWVIEADATRYRAPILVNAAGAWCDEIARLAGVKPVGLVPKRRTAFAFAPPPGLMTAEWPLCLSIDGTWYMKPDAGLLLGSPANADPVSPHDVQPEAIDIALGVDAIEGMTTLNIHRPIRAWAGLRSFVPDGNLVGGFDPESPGFFWIAGQGGYGVQTSAAMGETCASLVLGKGVPSHAESCGVAEASLSPARLPRI
jgi:D-arginine dehydrogenase